MPNVWGMTPAQSLALECERRGREDVVKECVVILTGQGIDAHFLRVLAGPSADAVLEGRWGGVDGYWPSVWAARGLLHVWDDSATDALINATSHNAWRVREMTAKVVARHHVDAAVDAMVRLFDDDNARVRTAARRAFNAVAQS